MLAETKRGLRFPRKHFRRFITKRRVLKDMRLYLRPLDEIRKTKLKLDKIWIEMERNYDNKGATKTKDEKYWQIVFYRKCIDWLLKNSSLF